MLKKKTEMTDNKTRLVAADLPRVVRARLCWLAPLAAFAFALSLPLVTGCTGGCTSESDKPAEPEPILDRMKDPEYQKLLEKRREGQSEIVKRGAAIERELEAARAEDPESEKTKELEKRRKEVSAELEIDRQVNMGIIRARMLQEKADREKVGAKKEVK